MTIRELNSSERQVPTPFGFGSYGLSLHADRPIPGLFAQDPAVPADVQVWLGDLPPSIENLLATQELWYTSSYLDEFGQPGLRIWKLADGGYFRLRYVDGTEFVIDRRGTKVWSTWSAEGSLADAASYLLGPILGFVLRLRGVTCLHSSAISLGEQAVAFVGPERAGKSTTAAAFAGLGYPVLADDIVALSSANGSFFAQPGCPRLRLWPSSIDALARTVGLVPDSLPPGFGNRRYYLDLTRSRYEFERRTLPLAAIYFLAERTSDASAPYVNGMTGSESVMTLVANTYAAKLLDSAGRAQEFEFLDKLVKQVPLRRVYPHAESDYLARLCDVILNDLQDLRTLR